MAGKGKSVTSAELAVLSLLAEQPMHGYQIDIVINARGMRDWTTIGFSSIYYILEKLRKIGWLDRQLNHGEGKGPARQIFHLTKNGRDIWKEAVLEALSHPSLHNNNFQLALSNLNNLEVREAFNALENYLIELGEIKVRLQAKLSSYGKNLPWNAAAMFNLSLIQLEGELTWLTDFISQMREMEKDIKPIINLNNETNPI